MRYVGDKIKVKLLVITIILLLTLIVSCADVPWILVEKGVLTDLDTRNYTSLTFDNERIVLLNGGYTFEYPTSIILGKYYYLYKEDAGASHNGYHLVEEGK